MAAMANVTEYQARVYTLLQQIPEGKVSTYAALSKAMGSSPRAVGGALRRNPYAPRIPCHRVISADGYVGGFKGEWQKAPSGVNQAMKLDLLAKEGVKFSFDGKLLDSRQLWAEFEVRIDKSIGWTRLANKTSVNFWEALLVESEDRASGVKKLLGSCGRISLNQSETEDLAIAMETERESCVLAGNNSQ